MRWFLTILAGALLATDLLADGEPGRDFTGGFERLRDLARIPDLSQAEPGYICGQKWTRTGRWLQVLAYDPAEGGSISWRLGENPDGSSRILLDGWLEVPLYPPDSPDETRLRGRWLRAAPCELEWALAREARAWAKRTEPTGEGSGLLLGATYLFAAGKRQEANEIASVLLRDGTADSVLGGVCQTAANRLYHQAFVTFVVTHDRSAFLQTLADIVDRSPVGWDRLPVVQRILRSMRTPGAAPDTVAFGALDVADRELLAELMWPARCEVLPELNGWLLLVPGELVYSPSSDALRRLLGKGTAALPLILALADDPRPSRYLDLGFAPENLATLVGSQFQTGMYPDRDFSAKVRFTRRALERPGEEPCLGLPHLLSGRQLACILLGTAWKRAMDASPADDVDEVRQWLAANQGVDRRSLAQQMLADPRTAPSAISYLLADPPLVEEYPAVEKALLRVDAMSAYEALVRLVQLRGEDARPAVDQVLRQLLAVKGNVWFADEVVARLLPAKDEARTLADLRDALAKPGGVETFEGQSALAEMVGRFPDFRTVAGELLEAAANSDRPVRRDVIFCVLADALNQKWHSKPQPAWYQVRWEGLARFLAEHARPDGDRLAAFPARRRDGIVLDWDRHVASWDKLIGREAPPDQWSGLYPNRPTTWTVSTEFLRMYALEGYQRTVGRLEGPDASAHLDLEMLPGGSTRLAWERARALLADPNALVAQLPDPALVPSARVAEIVGELRGLSADQGQRRILALSDPEHLAVLAVIGQDEALARQLFLGLRRQLPPSCRYIGDVPSPIRRFVAGLTGERISRQLAERMLKEGQELVGQGHCFALEFVADSGVRTQLVARSVEPVPADHWNPGDLAGLGCLAGDSPLSGLCLNLELSRTSLLACWPAVGTDAEQPVERDRVLIGSDGARSQAIDRQEELLAALASLPEDQLSRPYATLRFCLFGLNRETWQRLRQEGASRPQP